MSTRSCAIRSQSEKIVKFVILGLLIFFDYESTYNLTDLPSLIYDRKTAARPFDLSKADMRQLQAGTNAYETVGSRLVQV